MPFAGHVGRAGTGVCEHCFLLCFSLLVALVDQDLMSCPSIPGNATSRGLKAALGRKPRLASRDGTAEEEGPEGWLGLSIKSLQHRREPLQQKLQRQCESWEQGGSSQAP